MQEPNVPGRFLLLWLAAFAFVVVVFIGHQQQQPRAVMPIVAMSRLMCGQVQEPHAGDFVGRLVLRDIAKNQPIAPDEDLGPDVEVPSGARVVTVRGGPSLMPVQVGDQLGLVPVGLASPVPSPTIPGTPGTGSSIVNSVVLRVGEPDKDGLVPLLVAVPDQGNNLAVLEQLLAKQPSVMVAVFGEARGPAEAATPRPTPSCPKARAPAS